MEKKKISLDDENLHRDIVNIVHAAHGQYDTFDSIKYYLWKKGWPIIDNRILGKIGSRLEYKKLVYVIDIRMMSGRHKRNPEKLKVAGYKRGLMLSKEQRLL